MSYSWGNDTSESWSGGGVSYPSAKKAYNPSKAYVPPKKKSSYSDYSSSSSYDSGSSGSKKSSSKKSSSFKTDMKSIYMVSARVMDAALTDNDKDMLKVLGKDDLIVVPGQYDSVEKVFEQAKTPYRCTSSKVQLDPRQIVFINCPGKYVNFGYKGKSGTSALEQFVHDGGYLVTTDWALDNVVMNAFPGYIEHAGKDTTNDVVEVDMVASYSPFTRGLGKGSLKPIWWLESSSYPVKPMRSKDLDILLASSEMEKKYGYGPIAVKFKHGQGRVIHATSHFYLQTTKSKYDAQENLTGLDFATKFIGMAKKDASEITGIDDISFGALESGYTSIRFLHNILIQRIRKNSGYSDEDVKKLGGKKAVSIKKLQGPSSVQKSKKLI